MSGVVDEPGSEPEPDPAPDFESEPPPDPAPEPPPDFESEPEPVPDPLSEPPSDVELARDAEREAELRSFFAQPVPRKWIVGAENALRTGAAPQIPQIVGPSAVTE